MTLNKNSRIVLACIISIITLAYSGYCAWLHTDSYPTVTVWDKAIGITLLVFEFPWVVLASLPHVPQSLLPIFCAVGQASLLFSAIRPFKTSELQVSHLLLRYVIGYIFLVVATGLLAWKLQLYA